MADQAASLQILIDIRSRLDALEKTQREMRGMAADTRDAAKASAELRTNMQQLENMAKLGSVFAATGLTIQNVTQVVLGAITATSQLAGEIERASGRLGFSAEGYQVLAASARAARTEFTELLSGAQAYRERLGAALVDPKAGAALMELKLSARELADLPLERQMERIAQALGGVSDDARRAALAAQLFGGGAAALRPVLESLRVDGFDKMRDSVRETAGLLSNEAATAIEQLGDRAEMANHRLGIALGRLNTRLLESKADIAETLADNGGVIGSGIEAAIEAAMFFGVLKALQKLGGGGMVTTVNTAGRNIGRSFDAGFGTGTAMIGRQITRALENGSLATAMGGMGRALATPFGAAFAVAVGAIIINELERAALERIGRKDAENEAAAQAARQRRTEVAAVRTDDDQAALLAQYETDLSKAQAPNSRRATGEYETIQGWRVPKTEAFFDERLLTEAQRSNIENLERQIELLKSAVMERIKEEGAANDAAAATAARQAEEAELWKKGGELQVETANRAKSAVDSQLKIEAARDEQGRRLRANEKARALEQAKEEADALRKSIEAGIVRQQSVFDVAEAERQAALANPDLAAADRAKIVAEQLKSQRDALAQIIVYRRQLAGLPGLDPLEKATADAGVATAESALENHGDGTPPLQSRRQRSAASFQRRNRGESEDGTEALGFGEGFTTGAMDWVTNLGSAGEQVAGALQSTLGATVSSISDGIYGWITGTGEFGDVLNNLGATVFQTMLNTIIQMGVQWLVNAALIKMGMLSIETMGDTLRAGRVVKENAAEAATLPAKTAGAAASGISSWGVTLAFGAAAVALIMGLLGGFASGGYTGPGGKYEPAGIVHRGEDVWSQDDVARWGGIANVEAMRVGGPAAIEAMAPAPMPILPDAPASPLDAGAAIAGALAVAGAAATTPRPSRTVVVDDRRIADQMAQEPGVTTFIQSIVSQMLPS